MEKHERPSWKRLAVVGTLTVGGIISGVQAVDQALQKNYSDAASCITSAGIFETGATIVLIDDVVTERKRYEYAKLGGTISRHQDLMEQLIEQ